MKQILILKAVLLLTANCLLPTVSSACQLAPLWAPQQTSNPSVGGDFAYAITADASGIYVAGKDNSSGNAQWRIEKRNLTTGALMGAFGTAGVGTSNPSAGEDEITSITTDASGIYVAGYDNAPGNAQWRIEKRDLTTGALIAAFGTAGAVTSNPSTNNDMVTAITADASGIYVVGYDNTSGDPQWRIEKRDKTTGALIAAFGTAGVVTSNPSTDYDMAYAITADASGIYVAGVDESAGFYNWKWRVEKRDLTTGALIAAFGTGGKVTSDPSTGDDVPVAITADVGGIYIAGWDRTLGSSNEQWRIEKRDKTTGALIPGFGAAGVVTSNPSTANDWANAITADAGGIYVAGYDRSPGNGQWRIEKRDLTTGALSCSQVSNPSASGDEPLAITADASGIYVAGYDYGPGNSQWRIEKYDLCGSSPPTANASSTNINCNGACNGTASVAVSNGTSPYAYSWSPGGKTTQTITGLCADSYTVTVTDAAGSTAAAVVTITQPIAISFSVTSTSASCAACADGTASANASGGTPGYAYSWSLGGQTTQIVTGLMPGTYTVCVTDANGCTECDSVTVTFSTEINDPSSASSFLSVYPNPGDGKFIIEVTNIQYQPSTIEIYNVLGEKVYVELVSAASSTIDISSHPKGMYFIQAKTDNGIAIQKLIIQND